MTSQPRAHIVGLGLIGGSIAMALRRSGWVVTGQDLDPFVTEMAIKQSVISGSEPDNPQIVFIATPSQYVASIAQSFLVANSDPELIVTDVAGVKESIVEAVNDARFVGGHPMAGSEMKGLEGSRQDLFDSATWVLTPTDQTPADTYARLHAVVASMGAAPLALPAQVHDRLVAMASHVPHLVAGALMNEASHMAESDGALLRLAAGGFRDMTRISAGEPEIWPNVLFDNQAAVVDGLDRVIGRLQRIRQVISHHDRESLLTELSKAAVARRDLPGRASIAHDLVIVRIPIDDRPGMLASITTLASNQNVNIFDIEIVHGVEGQSGLLELSIERDDAVRLSASLVDAGFKAVVNAS